MERRLVFGSVAQTYDRARPSYPEALVADVLAVSPPCERAIEVGMGTGKATTLFAQSGIEILALEPSPEMAAVGRARLAAFPNVSIRLSDFEAFEGDAAAFDLIYSAQAWHWVSPEVRYVRARQLLRPGGVLGLFWNRAKWESNPLREELLNVYEAYADHFGADPGPMHPGFEILPGMADDWGAEIDGVDGFGEPELRVYEWAQEYSAEAYVELIATHSDHILLGPERFEELADGVARVIKGAGGRFTLDYAVPVFLVQAQ